MGDSDEEIETEIEERIIMSKEKDAIPDEKTIKYHILDVNTIKTTSWKRKRSKTASLTEGDSQKKRRKKAQEKKRCRVRLQTHLSAAAAAAEETLHADNSSPSISSLLASTRVVGEAEQGFSRSLCLFPFCSSSSASTGLFSRVISSRGATPSRRRTEWKGGEELCVCVGRVVGLL